MEIAKGLDVLEISSNILGNKSTLYLTLIHDHNTVILVDTGHPGQLPQIRDEMENVGVPFEELDMVIISHQDIDHIENLSSIQKELSGNVKVFAHEEEKPQTRGRFCCL